LHAQAHFNLGNVFRQCGEFEAAERCYSNVLRASPGHWRALLNLSVALAGLGRNSEAHRALRASFKASGAVPSKLQDFDYLVLAMQNIPSVS
jgi:Flp pilus assembly protein TadD